MVKLTIVCLFIIAICVVAAQECKEGETKQVQCNTCTCTANGKWACTLKGCLRKRETQECETGETKQEECNTCRCTNGNWACTRKACQHKREAVEDTVKLTREKREVIGAEELAITPCAPNDYFQLDCDVCYCKTDGTGYLCTDNTCSDAAWALSTTTQIPLSNDSMLIMSNYGVELIENLNSNDNSVSRIAKLIKTEPLADEAVDPEIVDFDAVDSKTDGVEVAESRSIDCKTDKPKTNRPASVKPASVEPATSTVESASVESQTVKTKLAESVSEADGRKNSPRSPNVLAKEQRRLAAELANQ